MSIIFEAPALSLSFRFLFLLLLQFRRSVNRWVANMLANRARQAKRFVASRQLSRRTAHFHRLGTPTRNAPQTREEIMNSIFKSKVTAFAFGIVAVAMMSLAPAMAATTTTRDHRTKPVVRDHRANAPEVRDHRKDPKPASSTSGGGVSVKDAE